MNALVRFAALAALLGTGATAATAAPQRLNFTVPGVDDVPDLHGNPTNADLVVFAAGNQFMVMPHLMAAFAAAHPEVKNVFYETLPPGIETRQMRQGTLEIGNLVVDIVPDILMSSLRGMKLERKAGVVTTFRSYAQNGLAIEVAAGNPKAIHALADLGRDDVRVVMPNPKWEGVAEQIESAYRRAGGDALDAKIMHEKLAAGTTILTRIHHRETPLAIVAGRADAGCVWLPEALYAKRIGKPIEAVLLPQKDNATATYVDAVVRGARHLRAARAFADFLSTPQAAAIYRDYGFTAPAKGLS